MLIFFHYRYPRKSLHTARPVCHQPPQDQALCSLTHLTKCLAFCRYSYLNIVNKCFCFWIHLDIIRIVFQGFRWTRNKNFGTGNKPLTYLIMTQICHHLASVVHNGLNYHILAMYCFHDSIISYHTHAHIQWYMQHWYPGGRGVAPMLSQ